MLGPVFNLGGGLVVRLKMLVISGYTLNPKPLSPKPISINSRAPGEGSFGLPERRGRSCANFSRVVLQTMLLSVFVWLGD